MRTQWERLELAGDAPFSPERSRAAGLRAPPPSSPRLTQLSLRAAALGPQEEHRAELVDQQYLDNLLAIGDLEHKFAQLARRFRRFMNFLGLVQDVELLLVSGEPPPGRAQAAWGPAKCLWLAVILFSNLLTAYMVVAHSLWEIHRLDAKMSAYGSHPNSSRQQEAHPQADAAFSYNGWSILKDFLENLRRHLSRYFALAMIFIWHKNCHKFELLFLDCRQYYAAFYLAARSGPHALDAGGLFLDEGPVARTSAGSSELRCAHLGGRRDLAATKERQAHSIAATGELYALAARRVRLALVLPLVNLSLQLLGTLVSPSALRLSGNRDRQLMGAASNASHARVESLAAQQLADVKSSSANSLAARMLHNFNSFQLAIHTAFHPVDHQIGPQSTESAARSTISLERSALYFLLELIIHYVYIHGPRILGATCLSLILSIHRQCLGAFNRHLSQLVRRAHGRPLTRGDMASVLKKYDMIGLMHERIERTFKWSLVLWFSLMFVSCLMLIFTLTESTSAALIAQSAPSTRGPQQMAPVPASFIETISHIVIISMRILYFCYAPWLIYSEAFKIEAESLRTSQLLMLLARRQDDIVAQAIEPSLFEPIYLSVGGYFSLSKRSVASLVGAIVTFSIMFIVSLLDSDRHWAWRARAVRPPDSEQLASNDSAEAEEQNNELELEAPDDEDDGPDDSERPEVHGEQEANLTATASLDGPAHESWRASRRETSTDDEFRGGAPTVALKAKGEQDHEGGHGQAVKARAWRKLTRLNSAKSRAAPATSSPTTMTQLDSAAEDSLESARPKLAPLYRAELRENERRLVSVTPKLRVENQVEICDVELLGAGDSRAPPPPFSVTWIDRINGEISVEASDLALVNCERQRNHTLRVKAIGCNGLESDEATLQVELLDVNEFSPEFERGSYAIQLGLGADELSRLERRRRPDSPHEWCHLLTVRAHDQDCSLQFGQVCRYELLLLENSTASEFAIDLSGDLAARCAWLERAAEAPLGGAEGAGQQQRTYALQALAFDCAGKKSQAPASVLVTLVKSNSTTAAAGHSRQTCRAAWKDVDTQLTYRPSDGERWPFLRAQLDLCAHKCHRPNLTVRLQLEARAGDQHRRASQHYDQWVRPAGDQRPASADNDSDGRGDLARELSHANSSRTRLQFHCDRDPYAMVSRRRLCGARRRAIELLPPFSAHTKWVAPLVQAPRAGSQHEALEEENLGAYLQDGSYGRLASDSLWLQSAGGPADQGPGSRSARAPGEAAEMPGAGSRSWWRRVSREAASQRAGAVSGRRQLDASAIYRDQVYHFDGIGSALQVPPAVYLANYTHSSLDHSRRQPEPPFGARHTLSFWMRHEGFRFRQTGGPETSGATRADLAELSRHVREHILCATSAPQSRPHLHYYAIYLKNCKLVLSMREPSGAHHEHSAEWRWSGEGQFCDNKWHLYTVNVNFQQAELYVDGRQLPTSSTHGPGGSSRAKSPAAAGPRAERADPRAALLLTVGACTERRASAPAGQFRGSLSGLNVVANSNDDLGAIECLGRCTEALVSSAPQRDQQQSRAQDNSLVSYQDAQDRIQLEGHDLLDLEDALAQVAYVNRRELPSVGQRTIGLETTVRCSASSSWSSASSAQEPHEIAVAPLKVEISVAPSSSLPLISIAGTPNLAREHAPFLQGKVAPFELVRLRVKTLKLTGAATPATSARQRVEAERAAELSPDYIDDSGSQLGSGQESDRSAPLRVSLELSENLATSCRRRIEACNIAIDPPLEPAHEELKLPTDELDLLALYWRQSNEGALIYGLDCVENYELLLRSINYKNSRPDLYHERLFRLTCSDMSGRLLSNEFLQTVTIIHPRPGPSSGRSNGSLVAAAAPPHQSSAGRSFFAALKSSGAGPRHSIGYQDSAIAAAHANDGDQLSAADTKLNRLAIAFLVFVISMMVIMLLIALTNLRESAASATTVRKRRRRRAKRLASASGGPDELLPCGSYACVELARADSYFAQHEDFDGDEEADDGCEAALHVDAGQSETETETESESLVEGEEQVVRCHGRPCSDDVDQRRCRFACSPSDATMDSLSWDDELPVACPKPTTIVVNPLVHGQTPGEPPRGGASSAECRQQRALVARLNAGDSRPETQLAGAVSLEDVAKEQTGRAAPERGDDDYDDDLIEMDEDMLTSACSRSRSDSASSAASQQSLASTIASATQGDDTTQQWSGAELSHVHEHHQHYRLHRDHRHDHHHHQPRAHERSARCNHRLEMAAGEGDHEHGDPLQQQQTYELYHKHHHHLHHQQHHQCLRARQQRRTVG